MAETDGGGREQITAHLTEMHRLVRHGAEVTGRQVEHSAVGAYPEVEEAVWEVQRRLENQAVDLEQRLTHLGHAPDAAPPAAALPPASAASVIVDIQAFLPHLSLEYQRLKSAGRSRGDDETTDLAGRGYEDTQTLLREQLSRAAPRAARLRPSMNPPGMEE